MRNLCGKCKEAAGCVWTTDGARCRSCFENVTLHSVKTVLSKNRLVAFRSRICVGCNPASISTAALLEVLKECLEAGQDRRASRMSFEVVMLHVLLPEDLFGGGDRAEDLLKEQANKYGFQMESLQLESHLEETLRSIRDITDKREFVAMAVQQSLIQMTRDQGCEVLLEAKTATDIAVETLALTVKGRGVSIPDKCSHVSVVDGIRLGRPFRDLTARHVVRYARLRGIDCNASALNALPDEQSLDGLSTKFLTQLQENQPSTSFTVVRTAARLHPANRTAGLCTLCASEENTGDETNLCMSCSHMLRRGGAETDDVVRLLQR